MDNANMKLASCAITLALLAVLAAALVSPGLGALMLLAVAVSSGLLVRRLAPVVEVAPASFIGH